MKEADIQEGEVNEDKNENMHNNDEGEEVNFKKEKNYVHNEVKKEFKQGIVDNKDDANQKSEGEEEQMFSLIGKVETKCWRSFLSMVKNIIKERDVMNTLKSVYKKIVEVIILI